MHPDRVEVSWDGVKSKWLVRIETGAEVIRRYWDGRKDADEETVHSTAQKTVQEEGFELDPAGIVILH